MTAQAQETQQCKELDLAESSVFAELENQQMGTAGEKSS